MELAPHRLHELTGSRSHDLEWLVGEAGSTVDDPDRELLRRLGRVIKWAARYPAPKDERGYATDEPWPRQVHDGDFDRVEVICGRLRGLRCARSVS